MRRPSTTSTGWPGMAFLLLLAWMVDILGCGSGRWTFEDFGVQFEFNSRNTDYLWEHNHTSQHWTVFWKSWEATSLAKLAAQTLHHLNSKTKSKHKSCSGTSISQKAPSKHINHWTHLPATLDLNPPGVEPMRLLRCKKIFVGSSPRIFFSTKNTEKYGGHLGSLTTWDVNTECSVHSSSPF